MTSLAFLDLTVTQGPNQGMRYSIPEGTYRILARYEPGFVADDRILNPDQQERVLSYLPKKTGLIRGPDILLDDSSLSTAHAIAILTPQGGRWVDLIAETEKTVSTGDTVNLGSTQLKVS